MATKNNRNETTIIDVAANAGFAIATRANDFMLKKTEQTLNTSLMMAEKGIHISSKIFKTGLKITASQQDLAFDILESLKRKIVKK